MMEATEYFEAAKLMMDNIIHASKFDILKMNEQEKQILGAFYFGVLNAYSLERHIGTVHIQGAMIAVLVQKLKYDPAVAAQFFDFLTRCTAKNYHPTVNTIIHRGVEGYYQLDDIYKLRENISEVLKVIKKYND